MGDTFKDRDGREYEFWINEWSQRWWRCVEDPSVLVPYDDLAEVIGRSSSSRDPVRPARDPWLDGLYSKPFWEE
jgi:hypothetical protein